MDVWFAGTVSGYGPLYWTTAKFDGSQALPALVPLTVTLRLPTASAWLFGLLMDRSTGCAARPGARGRTTLPDRLNGLELTLLSTVSWTWE